MYSQNLITFLKFKNFFSKYRSYINEAFANSTTNNWKLNSTNRANIA